MNLSTFRVDLKESETVLKEINNYVKKHPNTKYLINSEISSKKHKEHFQGWMSHDSTLKSYNQHFNSTFKKLGLAKHQRSFAKVRESETYYSYILNNEVKPLVQFNDVLTNCTEEEFNHFKSFKPFIKIPTTTKREVEKSNQDRVFKYLEEHCVKDGIVQPHLVPDKYLDVARLDLSPAILLRYSTGYANRLETKYTKSRETKDKLLSEMYKLDKENFFMTPEQKQFIKEVTS